METEILLYWMTHLGNGSWNSFRNAASEISLSEPDLQQFCRNLRVHMSDMGYADFFIEGSQNWEIRRPILSGIPNNPNEAILIGGRTPKLLESLEASADSEGCKVVRRKYDEFPLQVQVMGDAGRLEKTAKRVGVPYLKEYARFLASEIVPIPTMLKLAPEDSIPLNWSGRYFDLETMAWKGEVISNSACEVTSRYGYKRYFLHLRHAKYLAISKREVMYASAFIQNKPLLDYNCEKQLLNVPLETPLPELCSRVVCLSSGGQARIENSFFVFEKVTPVIAAIIFAAVGQKNFKI